jgi:hypothetical protein
VWKNKAWIGYSQKEWPDPRFIAVLMWKKAGQQTTT